MDNIFTNCTKTDQETGYHFIVPRYQRCRALSDGTIRWSVCLSVFLSFAQ